LPRVWGEIHRYKRKVDANTLFGIASNSKAFTSASLAILVDEGKIKWDIKSSIPSNFKMYNEYVTQELLFVIY
jgi:hypothetical protein